MDEAIQKKLVDGEGLKAVIKSVKTDLNGLLADKAPAIHVEDVVVSEKGAHGIRYQDGILQVYDNSWKTAVAGGDTASSIAYDNEKSGITADNVQDALDTAFDAVLPTLTVQVKKDSTITITGPKECSVSGTSGEDGTFTTTLPRLGTYSVQAELNGDTAEKTIVVDNLGDTYTLALEYFSATLTVHTGVSGATVKAVSGENNYTGTAEDAGDVTLTIKRSGTYTVTATYSNVTSSSESVEVTEIGHTYESTVKFITLKVEIDTGSQITVSKESEQLQAKSVDGSALFYLSGTGTWNVSATLASESTEDTVEVTEYKAYTLKMAYISETLNDNTWAKIKKVSDAGQGKNYWTEGDKKTIKIDGKVGSMAFNNLSIDVFIIGFNHNSGKEGDNKIHFLLGKIEDKLVALVDSSYNTTTSDEGAFTMNTTNTNSGGWESSHMRKKILGSDSLPTSPTENTLLAALPEDLRAVMKPITKYTDNKGGGNDTAANVSSTTDYLPLLAEYEVLGERHYANSAELKDQQQYAYFSSGNQKIFYKHNKNSEACWAWLRSPYYYNYYDFCCISTSGSYNYGTASYSYGVPAAFAA